MKTNGRPKRLIPFPKIEKVNRSETLSVENLPTLAKNFPDVLLALLKRLNANERKSVLADFKKSHPEAFKDWFTPRTREYLEFIKSSQPSRD